jgi:homoserine dehydrogenase
LWRIISYAPTATSTWPFLQSFASVLTESLIPPSLEGIPTGDEFIARLPEFDEEFAELRTEASRENKVLRFVGVVDVAGGQVRAGLERYVVYGSGFRVDREFSVDILQTIHSRLLLVVQTT